MSLQGDIIKEFQQNKIASSRDKLSRTRSLWSYHLLSAVIHKTWLRGQDLHLRLKVMSLVLSYATTAPQAS